MKVLFNCYEPACILQLSLIAASTALQLSLVLPTEQSASAQSLAQSIRIQESVSLFVSRLASEQSAYLGVEVVSSSPVTTEARTVFILYRDRPYQPPPPPPPNSPNAMVQAANAATAAAAKAAEAASATAAAAATAAAVVGVGAVICAIVTVWLRRHWRSAPSVAPAAPVSKTSAVEPRQVETTKESPMVLETPPQMLAFSTDTEPSTSSDAWIKPPTEPTLLERKDDSTSNWSKAEVLMLQSAQARQHRPVVTRMRTLVTRIAPQLSEQSIL